jgi:hypothetical protein
MLLLLFADMMETTLAACARDTAWLENQLQQQHARQQQQQPKGKRHAASKQRPASSSPAAAQLDAAACARMLTYLVILPPNAMCASGYPLLTGPFAGHVQLCVRLSWALLQWDATISSSGSSGGGRRGSMKQYGQDCSNAEEHARWSLLHAATVGIGFSGDVAVEVAYRRHGNLRYPQLADQLADDAVFGLLVLNFALCVAAMHARVSQESSSQVPLPEQHHRVLLQQLGVEWLQRLPFAQHIGEQQMRQPAQFILAASATLSQHMNRAALGASSSSSTSASALMAAVNSSGSSSSSAVAIAAMQTLLQAALLPMPGKEVSWFTDMSGLLGDFLIQLSGSAPAAAAAVMLQPFVAQLMPAGLDAIRYEMLAAPSNSDNATPHLASENEDGDSKPAAATHACLPELAADLFCVSTAASLQVMLGTGGQQQQF